MALGEYGLSASPSALKSPGGNYDVFFLTRRLRPRKCRVQPGARAKTLYPESPRESYEVQGTLGEDNIDNLERAGLWCLALNF